MGGAQSTPAAGGAVAPATKTAAVAPATKTAAPTFLNKAKGYAGYAAGGLGAAGSVIAGAAGGLNKVLTTSETQLKALDLKAVADSGIPIIVLGIAVLAYVVAAVVCSFSFETPTNVGRISQKALVSWLPYGVKEGARNSMKATLTALSSRGVTADTMYLTNFYIQTVNVTGILFGNGGRPVASLDSIRFALVGGARAFVFDLWPDLAPGDAQRGPVLKTLEPGSAQRRTSYNSIPLASALSQLIYVAFQANYQSIVNDPIILYLRFRTQPPSKAPRQDTMELAAKALQATIQPYRLDAAFNRCRAQDTIPILPLSVFAQKVIVVSNTNGAGSSLADYINVAPKAGIPVDYEHTYYNQIQPRGDASPTDTTLQSIKRIQQNLSFVAPYGEDPAAASNAWDVLGAQKIGVHCCAMNMDPTKMPSPIETMFRVNSFVYKEAPLLYAPTTLPEPQTLPPLGYGQGLSAGSVTTPRIE